MLGGGVVGGVLVEVTVVVVVVVSGLVKWSAFSNRAFSNSSSGREHNKGSQSISISNRPPTPSASSSDGIFLILNWVKRNI